MKSVVLINYEQPEKTYRTCVDIITLHLHSDGKSLVPDSRHPNGEIFRDAILLDEHENAVLLNLELLYATNDCGIDGEFVIEDLFTPRDSSKKSHHPDFTGRVEFLVSRHANGVVPQKKRLLYEPNFVNLRFPFIPYIGKESAICSARSSVIDQYGEDVNEELFAKTDPFMAFFLPNRNLFPEVKSIRTSNDGQYCCMEKRDIQIVQSFFQEKLEPLILYHKYGDACPRLTISKQVDQTRIPEHINSGFSIIVIQLQATFLIVTPEVHRFNLKATELKF